MEPTLRSTQVLKQETEDIGLQGKDIAEYVTRLWIEKRGRLAERLRKDKSSSGWQYFKQNIKREQRNYRQKGKRGQMRVAPRFRLLRLRLRKNKPREIKNSRSRRWSYKPNKLKLPPVLRPLHPLVIKMPSPRSYHPFVDEKDELDSYLLCFEHYAENAGWEKDTWAIKLSALLTGRAMDVYTRMSDTDASDYNKLKKALLTRYNCTKNGYRKRFREATQQTEETPDQFVIRLKNYLAKWLELSGSSPENFNALVDLIVKEQFMNACSVDLDMYLLER